MKKVFGYIRVSSEGQKDGDGPKRQREAISRYCEMHGLELAGVYEDAFTGTDSNRPSWINMILDIVENGHEVKAIVVEKLDRLARDLVVQELLIKDDLNAHGIELISTMEGEDLGAENPTRKLIRQLFGAIAEYDKNMIVEKLRVARERKRAELERKAGKPVKFDGRKSYAESNPELVAYVRRLLQGKKLSYAQIAERLNGVGFKSKAKDGQWTRFSVRNLLKSV